jgi:hypothetical protein
MRIIALTIGASKMYPNKRALIVLNTLQQFMEAISLNRSYFQENNSKHTRGPNMICFCKKIERHSWKFKQLLKASCCVGGGGRERGGDSAGPGAVLHDMITKLPIAKLPEIKPNLPGIGNFKCISIVGITRFELG